MSRDADSFRSSDAWAREVGEIARRGAIFSLSAPLVSFPAGIVTAISPGRWFVWAATGATEFDCTVFSAAQVTFEEPSGAASFLHSGQEVACLVPISIRVEPGMRADWASRTIVTFWSEYDRGGRLRDFVDSLIAHRT